MKSVTFFSCIFLISFSNAHDVSTSRFLKKPKQGLNAENGTLQLVSVMFRHGNRTIISPTEQYPKDPYLNYSYFPLGYGQLTNAGKVKAFAVGTALRKRYNAFLGKFYYPEILEAFSTSLDRTKMSLQLALTGLFPPTKEDSSVTGLSWQPIPFQFVPNIFKDKVLSGYRCPKYTELYNKYISLPKYQTKVKSYQKSFDYIKEHTGLNIKTIKNVYSLYLGLATEEEYGLTLPAWTKTVWPEFITKLAIEEYSISMVLPDMRRLAIGYFLEKLLTDMNTKIRDTSKLPRKIHVYAAHENTMAQLLIALGVFERQIPSYGSYTIFELHKINDVYGVKIFNENFDGRGLRPLKMPNCKEFCPLELFTSLINDTLPTPELCDSK